MKKVIIITASDNNNLELAQQFKEEIEKQNGEAEVVNLVTLDLPMYSTLAEINGPPKEIINQIELLSRNGSMVFIAPEYNGGIPPLLTNYIAWISRSGNEDWRSCFNHKTAAIATHSGGGGLHVLMAMRGQLSFIGMNVLGQQILTNYGKELSKESLSSVVSML